MLKEEESGVCVGCVACRAFCCVVVVVSTLKDVMSYLSVSICFFTRFFCACSISSVVSWMCPFMGFMTGLF